MKIKNKKKTPKKLLFFLAIFSIVSLFLVYILLTNSEKKPVQTSEPITKEQLQEKERIANTIKGSTKEEKKSTSEAKQSAPQQTTKKEASLEIRTLQDESSLSLSTKLLNLPRATSCTLTVSSNTNSVVVRETAEVIYQPSFSTCSGFTIQKQQLPDSSYVATVTIYAGDKQEIISKNITIKVEK